MNYVVTLRFELILYIWEFECVMLNVSFVAPFLCNVPPTVPCKLKLAKVCQKALL
jgi:hypothetical protein